MADPRAGLQGKMALAAAKGDKTPAKLTQQFDVHPYQITIWEGQLLLPLRRVLIG